MTTITIREVTNGWLVTLDRSDGNTELIVATDEAEVLTIVAGNVGQSVDNKGL